MMAALMVSLLANGLCALGWFFLLTRLDVYRRHKGGTRMLGRFYLAGFLSLVPTFLLYFLAYAFWNPFLAGGWVFDFIDEMFITGPVEELSKFAVFFLLALRLKSIKEPMDGVLQAGAVALAFASAENVKYTMIYGLGVIPLRAILTTGGHLYYAAMWGYVFAAVVYEGLGAEQRPDYRLVFLALGPPAVFHGLYNFFIEIGRIETAVLVDAAALVVAVLICRHLHERSPYRPLRYRNPRQALAELTVALKHNPESPLLNQRLALLRLYFQDWRKCLQHAEACLRVHPKNPYFRTLQGVALILSGEVRSGAATLEDAYPQLPREQRLALHGNLRRVLGRREAAIPLPLAADYPHAYKLYCRILGTGPPERARPVRREAVTRRRYLARTW